MQPFGVLDRYIGKTIFTTIMMTLFMLVSLSGKENENKINVSKLKG